ncbi:hypothetical protein NQ318_001584 [Aromia moschata]|uniref:Nose resistant-to-fluoxetine protein N-terminal domain-containing protein n=1 Tax=Aromia moschata TaxID=1265417 RepID=A0AAV8Y147_9CUCU|nr:hypothetical protein NQ318_001584 [Aromia moschata]
MQSSLIISLTGVTASGFTLCGQPPQPPLPALQNFLKYMFDSSSKLQGGVLLGNLMDFGSFSQCLQIYKNSVFGPIHGKHCVLKIKPSIPLMKKILSFRNVSEKRFLKVYETVEKVDLAWSVCVPHSCPRDDIFRHFNKTIMETVEGLDVTVNLDDNYCNTVFNQPVMGTTQFIVLIFLVCFVFIGIIAAVLDLNSSEETDNVFVDTFSAYRNLRRITKIGRAQKELQFLHGLRVFSSWCVVIGHRFIMYIMFPVINQLEELDHLLENAITTT